MENKGRKKPKPMIFALVSSQIQVNDVVLISTPGSLGGVIRWRTKSDLSHAAICTQPGMLLEATLAGVIRRSVFATYTTSRNWLRVFRPQEPLSWAGQTKSPADYAEQKYAHEYATWRAAASTFPNLPSGQNGGVFCSEAVASSFEQAGTSLLEGVTPEKITPGMIATSPRLADITSVAVRELTAEANPEEYWHIVKTAEIPSREEDVKNQRTAYDAVKKALGKRFPTDVHSLPEFWSWLYEVGGSEHGREIDAPILAALTASGFFKWYEDQWPAEDQNIADMKTVVWVVDQAAAAGEPMDDTSREIHAMFKDIAPATIASRDNKHATASLARGASTTHGLQSLQRYADHREAMATRQAFITNGKLDMISAFDRWAQATSGEPAIPSPQ